MSADTHSPCWDHPGQSFNKSTGDCSCGGRHRGPRTITVMDVWGFHSYLAVNVDGPTFLKAMNAEAEDRGIKPNVPSDALDASRDVILMDAAAKVRCTAEIADGVLRLAPVGVTIDWAKAEEALQ